MRPNAWFTLFSIISALCVLAAGPAQPPARPRTLFAFSLEWQRCPNVPHWCETGWYASPAAADIDNDGQVEVVWGGYTLIAVNGDTGAIEWNRPASSNRLWPGIAVADLTGNGSLEVIAASHGGMLSVYDGFGNPVNGWPEHVNGMNNELRTLALADFDDNQDMEILVATTNGPSTGKQHWYVYEDDSTPRAGWPQLYAGSPGYAAGAYNQNVGIADLDGDGRAEIIGPNDTHYLTAYQDNGVELLAHSRYGTLPGSAPKPWSRVGVHVSDAVDLRGYANCGSEHRPNFANSAATIADLRGNGTLQVIVVGNVHNCGTSPYTNLYEQPYIFNADRSRWASGPYNWTAVPVPDANAAPLSEDYNLIQSSLPNPVAADLDGDGEKEILYASYDGRVHAYWLDKSEHGQWPFEVTAPGSSDYRFASEPVVADLDNNGQAEVIFASWTENASSLPGRLHIVSADGVQLQSIDLPRPNTNTWGGALGAPTLANLDGDANLEVVVGTVNMGLVAYELADSANARILWGTGRGSLLRTGSVLAGSLDGSTKQVSDASPAPGATLTYTVRLVNPGPLLSSARLTDTLPLNATLVGGSVSATSGAWGLGAGTLTWSGPVAAGVGVTVTYRMTVDNGLVTPTVIHNTVVLDDGEGRTLTRAATAIVHAFEAFLPTLRR